MSDATAAGDVDDAPPPRMGWGRAVLIGVAVLVVGGGGAVYGADEVLTRLDGLSRGNREYLASIVFLAVVIATAWLLRRLQARGTI